jgi:ribonuclease HII
MLLPYFKKDTIEAGLDEAGRGCLAGPVFAAAVILPQNFTSNFLNDSKKLTEAQRLICREEILQQAICYSIQQVSNREIDKTNILRASIKAMHLCIDALAVTPNHLIIDGNRFYNYKTIEHTTIIKGDGKYMSIAAASILAKTSRDAYMEALHKKFPMYNWIKNKGYPTLQHRQLTVDFGLSVYHRRTFSVRVGTDKTLFD